MKHLWIIERESSRFLYYYNYDEKKLDGVLVSGLLGALNSFSEAELKKSGIESIEMGGLRWVYANYPEMNLMLVAAGEKNENANLMRARLDIISKMFITTFELTKEDIKNSLLEISQFNVFNATLETLQAQWDMAEEVMNVGAMFDLLGVYQQLFIKLIKIIEENFTGEEFKEALKDIQNISPKIQASKHSKDTVRLIELFLPKVDLSENRIVFNRAEGTNIMGMNPIGLDKEGLKSMFFSALIGYKKVIISRLGEPTWLMLFNHEIRPFLFNQWEFLDKMNITKELLEILLENRENS